MAVVFLLVDKDIEIHGPDLSTLLYEPDRDPSQHDGRPSCSPPPLCLIIIMPMMSIMINVTIMNITTVSMMIIMYIIMTLMIISP